MYLIDYIAYGLHLWYKIYFFEEICRKPISQHPGLGKGLYFRNVSSVIMAPLGNADLSLSQDVRKSVFNRLPWKLRFCTINEAQKQYSLLDTISNYIFYLGPPGKYLYLSLKNPLHVGRRSPPTCSRFSDFLYRYFPGGPR